MRPVLSEIDKLILNKVKELEQQITAYELAKIVDKKYWTIKKRVDLLVKRGYLIESGGKPNIYWIDEGCDPMNETPKLKVKCIKCDEINEVFEGQTRRYCKKCKYLFWITGKRRVYT